MRSVSEGVSDDEKRGGEISLSCAGCPEKTRTPLWMWGIMLTETYGQAVSFSVYLLFPGPEAVFRITR